MRSVCNSMLVLLLLLPVLVALVSRAHIDFVCKQQRLVRSQLHILFRPSSNKAESSWHFKLFQYDHTHIHIHAIKCKISSPCRVPVYISIEAMKSFYAPLIRSLLLSFVLELLLLWLSHLLSTYLVRLVRLYIGRRYFCFSICVHFLCRHCKLTL